MTMAGVIEAVQRPALVIAHNKTLAAQLCNEFRTFFPDNAVEYFVSYYDYYQPEAYVPSRDLYIEKDSAINQEVDRLRHAATAAVFARRDVIVVASVSCIYGLGSPEVYEMNMQILSRGAEIDRDALLRKLVSIQYTRNDTVLARGTFRVRGETLEIFPAYAETAYRATLFGDEVERLQHFDPLTGELIEDDLEHVAIWPATHYNVREGSIEKAVADIGAELNERCTQLESEGKLLESHRLRQRTQYDMEMLREMGFCSGIENYSRILDGRGPGDRPYCLIDYFPKDFVCFIDESHQTVPQLGGMYEGDRSRKQTLVDYGFRLPSAMDNRPQRFEEYLSITPQLLFVSATPGEFERTRSGRIVEQIVRPTGIVDPEVQVRATRNQIDDLMNEIRTRVEIQERVLVTTLTKKMSEDLTQYLLEMGFRVRYLHSEIDTLERIQIIRDLRLGEYDVLVGVNLLREGLDLPEVSLVAILDADKEGFLRGETSLIQTIGRAARNVNGVVLMYADKETRAMKAAIEETDRRREIQVAYNEEHGITAASIVKGVSDIAEFLQSDSKVPRGRRQRRSGARGKGKAKEMPTHELERLAVELEEEMLAAAEELRFEYAAQLRDEIRELRRDLREAQELEAPEGGGRGARRGVGVGLPAPVQLDRQSIERSDFPLVRRGYDPAAVGAHLRALAAAAQELTQRAASAGAEPSLGSAAATRVQGILEAAQTTAAEIEREAQRDAQRTREEAAGELERARAHVETLARAAAALLAQVQSLDGEVSALARSLRARGRVAGARVGRARVKRTHPSPLPRRRSARHRCRPRSPRLEELPGAVPVGDECSGGGRSARRWRQDRFPLRGGTRGGAAEGRGSRRRAAGGTEYGAQRRVARANRPLPRRQLPALRSRQAARRGVRRGRGLSPALRPATRAPPTSRPHGGRASNYNPRSTLMRL